MEEKRRIVWAEEAEEAERVKEEEAHCLTMKIEEKEAKRLAQIEAIKKIKQVRELCRSGEGNFLCDMILYRLSHYYEATSRHSSEINLNLNFPTFHACLTISKTTTFASTPIYRMQST